MNAKTENNIKILLKLMVEAADIADTLSEDPTLDKRQQRQFSGVFNRLHKERVSIAECHKWFGIFDFVNKEAKK